MKCSPAYATTEFKTKLYVQYVQEQAALFSLINCYVVTCQFSHVYMHDVINCMLAHKIT